MALFFAVIVVNKAMKTTEEKLKVGLVVTNMSVLMLANMSVTRQSFNGLYTCGYFLLICFVVTVTSCVKGCKFLT